MKEIVMIYTIARKAQKGDISYKKAIDLIVKNIFGG